jgi:hypothetical protein
MTRAGKAGSRRKRRAAAPNRKRLAAGADAAGTRAASHRSDITFRVYRVWTERFEDETGRRRLHGERAKLLHGLVDTLGLKVKDWGDTDSVYPREVVEVVLALAPVVIPAIATVINTWIKESRIKQVTIKKSDGSEIDISGASPKQLKAIVEAIA